MKLKILNLTAVFLLTSKLSASTWSCSGLCGFLPTQTMQPVSLELVSPPLLVTGNAKTAEAAFQETHKKCDGKTPMLSKVYLLKKEVSPVVNQDLTWSIATIRDSCVKD